MRVLITNTATYTIRNRRVTSKGSSLRDLVNATLLRPISFDQHGCAVISTDAEPTRTTSTVYFDGQVREGEFMPRRMVTNRDRAAHVVASDLCWDCGRVVSMHDISVGWAPLSRIGGDSKYGYQPCCRSCNYEWKREAEYDRQRDADMGYARS